MKNMKVYFHFQLGVSYDHGTISAVLEASQTNDKLDIKSCLKQISKQLFDNMKIDVNPIDMEVTTSKKKALEMETNFDTLEDGADLLVIVHDDANKSKVVYEKTIITKEKKSEEGMKSNEVKTVETSPEIEAFMKNAKSYLSRKHHDLALAEYKQVVEVQPNHFDALFGLAYLYFKAKRYEASLPYFEKVVSKASADHVVLLDYGKALIKSGDATKAVSVISRCINELKRGNKQMESIHDANVVLGEALESMEQLPNAFQLFLTVAQMTDKQHLDGLLGYARVGYRLGQVTLDDVFIVVLNAIAQRKNDESIQAFFTAMVQREGGYEALQRQMGAAWMDAPAIVYIATFLREHGAVSESLRMLQHAFHLESKSVDIALLITHLHENMCTFEDLLKFAADFLDGKLDRQVVRKKDLSPIVKIIRRILEKDLDALLGIVAKEMAPEKEDKGPSPKGDLVNLELQLLALYFTVVKTCYVVGHLEALPVFIKLVDPLFKMNENLYKTLIRNEQAYYACISQIYSTCPPPVSSLSIEDSLYFVGDSHVLPVAWRNLTIKETKYTIKPMLVTGLKIWHLRKESKFYTKSNFRNCLQLIPNGSFCVFAFGEIDCREGIVRAVRKCAYDSLDDCVKYLVDVYVKRLLEVQRNKKLKIFVHPVPPVLRETIGTVSLFNTCLKNRVAKTSKLSWLDFVDELLDDSSEYMKEEYRFDGAHLHPKYVDVLEKSFQQHF